MAKLKMKTLDKFPKTLWVAQRNDGEAAWLDAHENADDCMEDDGPQLVAFYRLETVSKLQKVTRTIDSVSRPKLK